MAKKVTVRVLSSEGDTVTVLETPTEAEILSLFGVGKIVAVDGIVYPTPADSMDAINAVEEAELIVAKQSQGG